ncbi:MAG: extracellular solute-binding protein [Fibrobacterota bacterium]
MKGIRGIFVFLAALIAVSILSWFIPLPGRGASTALSDDRLVIITPHWDGLRNEFRGAFSAWYKTRTGRTVAVEYLDPGGGGSDCMRYILSEFKRSPEGIGIDLFFGGGTDPYLDLKKRGLLQPVYPDSSILNAIPQQLSGIEIYDREGYWFSPVLSGFGIVYNKWVCAKMGFRAPREWKDLADPAFFSWVGAADPRSSGTMHMMFELILQAYGWDEGWRILTGLSANTRAFSKSASDVPRMTAKGDLAFGLAVDFYGWAQVAEAGEDKVGVLLPENLTVISGDAMAVLKGAPHAETALRFVEFTLSEKGQKLLYVRKGTEGGPVRQELNRMPVCPDIYANYRNLSNVRTNPFEAKGMRAFDMDKASGRWLIVNDLAGNGLIDRTGLLKAAWQKAPGHPDWVRMPVTEAQADSLAKNVWKDPVARNRILAEWQKFFEGKYEGITQSPRASLDSARGARKDDINERHSSFTRSPSGVEGPGEMGAYTRNN